ncbi:MAG: hypothetical protein AAGB46_07090 [Verrucomicrobiota bacterium]
MDHQANLEALKSFQDHYDYDAGYLFELAEKDAAGFAKFAAFMPLSQHREEAPADAFFICHLIATQAADCGPCLQLVIKMAKEAGVPADQIQSALDGGDALPDELKLVRRYAITVSHHEAIDPELLEALQEIYTEKALAELALILASAPVYPTLKQALGHAQSCALTPLSI